MQSPIDAPVRTDSVVEQVAALEFLDAQRLLERVAVAVRRLEVLEHVRPGVADRDDVIDRRRQHRLRAEVGPRHPAAELAAVFVGGEDRQPEARNRGEALVIDLGERRAVVARLPAGRGDGAAFAADRARDHVADRADQDLTTPDIARQTRAPRAAIPLVGPDRREMRAAERAALARRGVCGGAGSLDPIGATRRADPATPHALWRYEGVATTETGHCGFHIWMLRPTSSVLAPNTQIICTSSRVPQSPPRAKCGRAPTPL